jgi:hypothetical protein
MKEERNMSKSKIVGMMALIAFAMGIFLVGDALAGEKFKGRTVYHTLKWDPINVGDEDGHVVAAWEGKFIQMNIEGGFGDGWAGWETCLIDQNPKTAVGSIVCYGYVSDRDGDKYYYKAEGKWQKRGKPGTDGWEWWNKIVKGTGKFEGIQGKTTGQTYIVAKGQTYTVWEMEVELPR